MFRETGRRLPGVPAGRRFFLAPAALVVAICRDRNGSVGAAPASVGGKAVVGAQELNMVGVAPPRYTAVTCTSPSC
jgi:hypothetical protein